jgi:hypothetical protein
MTLVTITKIREGNLFFDTVFVKVSLLKYHSYTVKFKMYNVMSFDNYTVMQPTTYRVVHQPKSSFMPPFHSQTQPLI